MWRFAVLVALAGCDGAFGLLHVYPQDDGGPGDGRIDAPRVRPDGQPANCPADYTVTLVTTASRYKLVQTPTADWVTAAAACAVNSTGAHTHLIVLSVPEEWDELRAQAETLLLADTWSGFSDRITEGSFLWVTAEPTQYGKMYMMPPWEADQPDGDSDCGELRMASGAMHDKDCATSDAYICECDDYANDPTRY